MVKETFAQGSVVAYRGAGICKVSRIEERRFAAASDIRRYYVLNPVDGKESTVYVPVDHPGLAERMRGVLSRSEIDELLDESRNDALDWVPDRKLRDAEYQRILNGGIKKDLLLMLRCIYLKKNEMLGSKKKLPVADEAALRRGETLVREEFAFALGLDQNDVQDYIQRALGQMPAASPA